MVNDQETTNIPRRSLLHELEKQALHISPSRVTSRPTRPRESQTSDFAAYYRYSSSSQCDPACSFTSHQTRPPPRRPSPRLLLHTYPCSAVTWNPYVQTASLEDGCVWEDTSCLPPDIKYELDYKRYDDDRVERPFLCRCAKCTDRRCPGNYYSSYKPPPPYRTNIMTFRDQWTMTLRVNEAATAVTPVPSYHGSEDSYAGYDYAFRDSPRTFTPDRGKPILKNRNNCKEYAEYLQPMYRDPAPPRLELSPSYNEPPPEPRSTKRDIDYEDEHVITPSRISSLFKFKKKKDLPRIYCPRRPLYNEGISDVKAGNISCFDRQERMASVTNGKKLRSKVSMKSKCCVNESRSGIPFSHHNDSKFHHDCTNPSGYGGSDPHPKRVVPGSRINKTSAPSNYQAIQFMPLAKNPRKLLTSERNVDSYAADGFTSASKLKRPSKRN